MKINKKLHYKTVIMLNRKQKELDTSLTKIEATLKEYEAKLPEYEFNTVENDCWITKDNVEITEEMAATQENWNLLLAVRQCIFWEIDHAEYIKIMDKLDNNELLQAE